MFYTPNNKLLLIFCSLITTGTLCMEKQTPPPTLTPQKSFVCEKACSPALPASIMIKHLVRLPFNEIMYEIVRYKKTFCQQTHPLNDLVSLLKDLRISCTDKLGSKRHQYLSTPYAFKVIPPELSFLFSPLPEKRFIDLVIESDDQKSLEELLKQGILLNDSYDQNNNTLLHLAALKNSPAIAAMLIQKGALLQALNDQGYTPLDLAENTGFLTRIHTYRIIEQAGGTHSPKKVHEHHLKLIPHPVRLAYTISALEHLT